MDEGADFSRHHWHHAVTAATVNEIMPAAYPMSIQAIQHSVSFTKGNIMRQNKLLRAGFTLIGKIPWIEFLFFDKRA
jgi:hypothetical protein